MKRVLKIMAVSMGLILAGCSTGGLPRGAHVVGGGVKISWSSPVFEPGTAILVEKTTGKTVMTKSLTTPIQSFDFDVTNPHDEQILSAVFGGSLPTNAQFVLYFVPRHE